MTERVWTVALVESGQGGEQRGGEQWGVFHEGRRVGALASRTEAEQAAVAQARKSAAALYPASVLVEEDGGVREVWPVRRRKRRETLPRQAGDHDGNAGPTIGYTLAYFAGKHRIPLDAARRILHRVGADRRKLDSAAIAFKLGRP